MARLEEFEDFIVDKIAEKWTHEQISEQLKAEHPGWQ